MATSTNTTINTKTRMTMDDIIADLLYLDELRKVQLLHQYNTGRELTIEEILMTFNNEQILNICEEFEYRLLTDYPVFAQEIALRENYINAITFDDDIINLQDELELLEAEQEFVAANSTNITDDMPGPKKSKN